MNNHLYRPAEIRKQQKKHDFMFSKGLGQNFLTDKNIIDKIIDGSGVDEESLVVEVGPGMGVLTAAAAERAAKVVAIELDRRLIPILEETLVAYDNIEVENADILKVNLRNIIDKNRDACDLIKKVHILGNLPYYITTAIIMKVLEERVPADSMTFMMQKEVADRIEAAPGTKDYGALSVAVQYYCEIVRVTNVSKEVFMPKPKVDSAVIRLDVRKEKPVVPADEALFFSVIKAGFGQRRKTLLNSLNGLCGLEKETIGQVLNEAGIDAQRRAETLSLREFCAVADKMHLKK